MVQRCSKTVRSPPPRPFRPRRGPESSQTVPVEGGMSSGVRHGALRQAQGTVEEDGGGTGRPLSCPFGARHRETNAKEVTASTHRCGEGPSPMRSCIEREGSEPFLTALGLPRPSRTSSVRPSPGSASASGCFSPFPHGTGHQRVRRCRRPTGQSRRRERVDGAFVVIVVGHELHGGTVRWARTWGRSST